MLYYLIDVALIGLVDDHMMISGLQPNTAYTFVVEARKMQKYADINEGTVLCSFKVLVLYACVIEDNTSFSIRIQK